MGRPRRNQRPVRGPAVLRGRQRGAVRRSSGSAHPPLRWEAGRVDVADGPAGRPAPAGVAVAQRVFTSGVPSPGNERVRMNLYVFRRGGAGTGAPSGGRHRDVRIPPVKRSRTGCARPCLADRPAGGGVECRRRAARWIRIGPVAIRARPVGSGAGLHGRNRARPSARPPTVTSGSGPTRGSSASTDRPSGEFHGPGAAVTSGGPGAGTDDGCAGHAVGADAQGADRALPRRQVPGRSVPRDRRGCGDGDGAGERRRDPARRDRQRRAAMACRALRGRRSRRFAAGALASDLHGRRRRTDGSGWAPTAKASSTFAAGRSRP